MLNIDDANAQARDAWNRNAAFWDACMGEGNDFVEYLIWPATLRLLQVRPGQRILDIACGNGLTSRRLAALDAEVVAFDIAEEMISAAKKRATPHSRPIHYHLLDATDEHALLALGEAGFDSALCSMALFDMAEVDPLFRALARLLKPAGRFVFSIVHPCFNSTGATQMAELVSEGTSARVLYSVKVWRYLSAGCDIGAAILGQPAAQPIFHRPLQVLLGAAFEAGFVLNGLEETSFPPDYKGGSTPLSWSGLHSEIPPVLVARLSLPTPA